MQLDCLRQYTTLLPGVAELTQAVQKQGIKIGSTTGFIRVMVDILEADAKEQGYIPDASVAGDEVVNGARPKPFMVYRNLDLLDIHPQMILDRCRRLTRRGRNEPIVGGRSFPAGNGSCSRLAHSTARSTTRTPASTSSPCARGSGTRSSEAPASPG